MSVVCEGDDVLYTCPTEGIVYLGVVVEANLHVKQFLIRFGDSSEKWSSARHLRRIVDDDQVEDLVIEEEDEEEIIDQTTTKKEDQEDEEELPLNQFKKKKKKKKRRKRKRSEDSDDGATPPPPPLSPGPPAGHVLSARRSLPYDFDSLLWDASHQRNDKERYCYCGESGDWYKKMLQCNRCLQWFHQDCLRKPSGVILFGDRFFELVCCLCNGSSEEAIRRLDLKFEEALHLVIFNLTVINNKKYHDLETAILPFFKKKWKSLQGPNFLLKPTRLDPTYMMTVLNSNKSRFKCGSEIKKRSTFWGLRKVAPPNLPNRLGGEANINYKCKLEKKQQTLKRQSSHTPVVTQPKKPSAPTTSSLKKRGRPPQKKAKLDLGPKKQLCRSNSSDDGDTSSSKGTLEAFIPTPKDFEGFNHPFRNLGLGTPPSSTPSFPLDGPLPSKRKRYGSSPPSSGVLTPIKQQKNENEDLKYSLTSYFGALTRIAKGERFNVLAKRLDDAGKKIQYLLEWEQVGPLSHLNKKEEVVVTNCVKESVESVSDPARKLLEEASKKLLERAKCLEEDSGNSSDFKDRQKKDEETKNLPGVNMLKNDEFKEIIKEEAPLVRSGSNLTNKFKEMNHEKVTDVKDKSKEDLKNAQSTSSNAPMAKDSNIVSDSTKVNGQIETVNNEKPQLSTSENTESKSEMSPPKETEKAKETLTGDSTSSEPSSIKPSSEPLSKNCTPVSKPSSIESSQSNHSTTVTISEVYHSPKAFVSDSVSKITASDSVSEKPKPIVTTPSTIQANICPSERLMNGCASNPSSKTVASIGKPIASIVEKPTESKSDDVSLTEATSSTSSSSTSSVNCVQTEKKPTLIPPAKNKDVIKEGKENPETISNGVSEDQTDNKEVVVSPDNPVPNGVVATLSNGTAKECSPVIKKPKLLKNSINILPEHKAILNSQVKIELEKLKITPELGKTMSKDLN